MVSPVSRDDVLAVMPNPILTKISGEPTYQNMKKWKKEISSNLISVRMPANWGQNKGLLGELQDPAVFLARNGAAYNPPAAAPPSYPVIAGGSTTAEREKARAEHAIDATFWATAVHAKRIAVNIGAAALEPFVYAELDDPDEGLDDVQIRDLYDHIMERFAKISQTEIDENLLEFNEGIDPSKTLAVYKRKQELCQEVAADAGVPITEATMVTTGTKHAVATGGMEEAWKSWMRTAANLRTWPAWKTHWTAAFQEKRELIRLTGITFNGMANQANEDEMGTKMVTALDNLANAAVQKNDTFEQLVKSNQALSTTISSQQTEIKRLLGIVSTLSCGATNNNKPNNTSSDTSGNWDPDGYCFWHGYKVKHGHGSMTCDKGKKDPTAYNLHKTAKRGDEQGGCTWNQNWTPK
jgi:hypothetical protein